MGWIAELEHSRCLQQLSGINAPLGLVCLHPDISSTSSSLPEPSSSSPLPFLPSYQNFLLLGLHVLLILISNLLLSSWDIFLKVTSTESCFSLNELQTTTANNNINDRIN